MGTTVIGGDQAALPFSEMGVAIQRRKAWTDDWEFDFDLEPDTLEMHTQSQGSARLVLFRRYGAAVKPEYEATEFGERKPLDLGWHWVRVLLLGEEGEHPLWVGRFENDGRKLKGGSAGQLGDQQFVAYGPDMLLKKTEVYESFWSQDAAAVRIGWHPSFNLRDEAEQLAGNRSSAKIGGSYLFGGTDEWSNFDALEYFVENFLNIDDQPVWTLGGQVDILKGLVQRVPFSPGFNLEQAIGALIDPKFGVDWKIVLTDEGFEIHVFALTHVTKSFGAYSLPRNPNEVRFRVADSVDMSAEIELSKSNLYDSLRLVGKRIKSTCSFKIYGGDWRAMWASGLESEYKDGDPTGGAEAVDHDAYRAADRFRDVYQAFAAVADWDFNGGYANPKMNLDGTIDKSSLATFQNAVRRTLARTCLREGYDYTQDPPTNNNLAGVESDFLPPLAVVYDAASGRYCLVDRLAVLDPAYPGVAVGVLEHEWGIRLRSPHNHMFAKDRFSGAADSQIDPDNGGFDYQTIQFTITIETDHPLAIGMDLPEDVRSGSGLTKVIHVADAEFWWLAPDTIVGIDSAGALLTSPGIGINDQGGMILRDDTEILAALMAGAVARYMQERARATVNIIQLAPWHDLLGQILTTVEDEGDLHHIGAPITSILFGFKGTRKMTIQTGHATR